jgi:hypothetical protein
LPVHISAYVRPDRISDTRIFIRCPGLHFGKLHCSAHLRPWGLVPPIACVSLHT